MTAAETGATGGATGRVAGAGSSGSRTGVGGDFSFQRQTKAKVRAEKAQHAQGGRCLGGRIGHRRPRKREPQRRRSLLRRANRQRHLHAQSSQEPPRRNNLDFSHWASAAEGGSQAHLKDWWDYYLVPGGVSSLEDLDLQCRIATEKTAMQDIRDIRTSGEATGVGSGSEWGVV